MRRKNPEMNNPPLSDSRVVAEWKNLLARIPDEITKAQEIDQLQAEKNARETGVFSLAESESSLLMWSHYGFHHTGFCIGYRTNVLYEALRQHAKVILLPVEYTSNCPMVNPYDPELTLDEWFSPFKVKHIDWAYEKERRIIYLNGSHKIIPIPENAIESVYLGMKINKHDEELLIAKLRARKIRVNLFRAIRQFNSFELKFEPVDYAGIRLANQKPQEP